LIVPIVLPFNIWYLIVLAYIFIASVAPVYILLQPRDYLNSFLLYAMIVGAVLGLILYRPNIQLSAVTAFNVNGSYLFPILFVTVACGAISGFHSLISSGTSSKQLNSEADAKLIGYGSMLIEGVLAVISLITAAYLGADKLAELLAAGGPNNVFSNGVGTFMVSFGIPLAVGRSFVALAISAFALTSLDSGTRIGRFVFQEFFEREVKADTSVLTNKFVATFITVGAGGLLGVAGWQKVWPVFGSANQLLAAIALMSAAVWLKHQGKNIKMFTIPMTFMFTVTMLALILLVRNNFRAANYPLVIIGSALLILALILAKQAFDQLTAKSNDKVA
jgi:carbon starvation protein